MEHHWLNSNAGSNGVIRPAFLATRLDEYNPLNFMHRYNYYDHNEHHQDCLGQVEDDDQRMMLEAVNHNMENGNNNLHEASLMDSKSSSYGAVHFHDMKKKRLNDEQLDALERSFREEIKLDPERKTRLARELGMQPRQIAVWFQNRRARWKNKQLERMYDTLKIDFDVVSREKLRLQEEVAKLRGVLGESLVVSPDQEDANNLLAMKKKQHATGSSIAVQLHQQMAGESTPIHFTGATLGQEYANSQQRLSQNFWAPATHSQLQYDYT